MTMEALADEYGSAELAQQRRPWQKIFSVLISILVES